MRGSELRNAQKGKCARLTSSETLVLIEVTEFFGLFFSCLSRPRPQAASVQYTFNGLAAGRVHRTHGRVSVRGVHASVTILQDLPMGSAHRNSFIFILSVLVEYNVSLCRVYRYKTEQGYHTSTAQLSVQYLKFIDSLFTTYEYSSIWYSPITALYYSPIKVCSASSTQVLFICTS